MATAHAGCFAFLPRSYSGYSPLYASDAEDEPAPAQSSSPAHAAVVVGKDRKTFMVDRWILQQEPLRVLLAVAGTRAVSATATARAGGKRRRTNDTAGCSDGPDGAPIFVDVDEILFEHVLWLARNGDGCADILGMHLRDIIEFYAHEDL